MPARLPLDAALFVRCLGRAAHPDHLPLGDTCPAVVLSREPWLIAVGADLNAAGTAGAPHPVIAVITQPLDLMTGGPPPVGARLAAAALYRGQPGAPRWESFDPVVAGCGCSDETAIARTLASIPGDAWASFLDALRALPSPPRAGDVYAIRDPPRTGGAQPPLARPARPSGSVPAPPPPEPAVYRMSAGVVAFVVAFLGGLAALLVQTYGTWWSVAGALPFWLGAAWTLRTIARRAVEVTADGLVWSEGGRTERARWDDVAGYAVDATVGAQGPWNEVAQEWIAHWRERRGHRFSKATDRVIVTVEFVDGRALALHQTVARSWTLFETVLGQADPRLGSSLVARVLGGATVECGQGLALAPFGLVSSRAVWSWDEVSGVTTIDGRVTVAARGERYWWKDLRSPGAVAWAVDALRLRAGG